MPYIRMPTLRSDTVVFISEDDLWALQLDGNEPSGPARRLSANRGEPSHPALAPDARTVAWTGRDEGEEEVYVMPLEGGVARRVTHLGAHTWVAGWRDRNHVLFVSDAAQPFNVFHLHELALTTGRVKRLGLGPVMSAALEPRGRGRVITRGPGGRGKGDPAMWKRYRGGLAGTLWIDTEGRGDFTPLIELDGDLANPMWIGRRIYFLSDHEGIANVYSCTPRGRSLRCHTDHGDYYARCAQSDGNRIVYTAGADLFLLDPSEGPIRLEVETQSTRPQRARRFVDAPDYLESCDVHPKGHAMCITARGKPFTFAYWEQSAVQRGRRDGAARYRFSQWLPDLEDVVAVSDEHGDDELAILRQNGSVRRVSFRKDLGRAIAVRAAPVTPRRIAWSNHRFELFIVDVATGGARRVDRSKAGRIEHMHWSPDGRWLVYECPDTSSITSLRLLEVRTGKVTQITRPDFRDFSPAFDAKGEYIYFLSAREFDPVYDTHVFDLGFPRGMRLLAIPLRADLPSPFIPQPRAPGDKPDDRDDEKGARRKAVRVDLRGIQDRIVACPIREGRFGRVRAAAGRIIFTSFPIEGSIGMSWRPGSEPPANGTLEVFDLAEQRREVLMSSVSDFELCAESRVLAIRSGNDLRVLPSSVKPSDVEDSDEPGRASGWLDLYRARLSVDPPVEWRQMVREAWRLQRDHYWDARMSGVDWKRILKRYEPLVDRVASRSELSDLIWEMQGELGTSHAYETGGDYRPRPTWHQGLLGADLSFDTKTSTWRIDRIPQGDSWTPEASSPLAQPGLGIRKGTRILAVDGRKVGRDRSPAQCLVNTAGYSVELTVADPGGGRRRIVNVRTLVLETELRYRDWVENNRTAVHRAGRGKIGYLHVPNMGPTGYAEFNRYYRAEFHRPALIIDVRYNGGGHVSHLLLEKLLRRSIGTEQPRWGLQETYPAETIRGPIVALTNEYAGSDGDIFSHSFKLFGIGPLIGKRTWGGVIGIWPRHALVDGSVTTQPEFAFQFNDVGLGVENYGTDPDIEVEITPKDHAAGRDPQLARAIEEARRLLSDS